jgi:hypothetical protein
MRLIVAVLLAVLTACGGGGGTPTPQTLRGKVYGSVSSGGKVLAGAKLTATTGSETKTATTDAKGEFSLQLSNKPATFTITAEPPLGSSYRALTYDNLPLEAYTSEFGAANEFNIYLPGGTAASGAGFPARFGCIVGTLTDGPNPVVSTTPAINNPPNRTSPANCDGTVPPNLSVSQTALQAGENGLVLFGGIRGVTTRAGGNFLIPVVTTNNGWAFSGSLWAGNYTGTDTGNPATAFEYFWDKFAYVPTTDVFLNGSSQTQNLQLEPFNPTTNAAKVTTLKVTPDTSALAGFNFADPNQGLLVSIPSFEHAITSAGIELGLYFFDAPGSRNLRVPKLQSGKQGQHIQVSNVALNANGARSTATFWRDGTNLSSEVKPDFLGIASPQAPANNATGVSRKPTLSWKAVNKARLYEVDIFQGNNLVWYGITDKTSLAVPITLPASTGLSWEVFAFDQLNLVDVVGREPAALYMPALSDHPRLAGLKPNPAQQWAKEQRANGYGPTLEFGGINLKATGYRTSSSESFSFTTGQ